MACIDPKDFFGIDLVDELRKRVNSSNHTNPFSILTLCNAKDTMTTDDVMKLQLQFDAHFRPLWTGNQYLLVFNLFNTYLKLLEIHFGKTYKEISAKLTSFRPL